MIDYANYPTISFMLMSLFFVITFQKVAKHPFLLLPFCKESSRENWWCQLSHSLSVADPKTKFWKMICFWNLIIFPVETNLIIFSWDTLLTCSRHRNLQNIRIRFLQIFVLILFNDSAINNFRHVRKEY